MKLLAVFFKGLFMGVSDIIPGISGGTIALITGIYERLIAALNGILTFKKTLLQWLLQKTTTKKLQSQFKKIDFSFLAAVLASIVLAIITGSHAIGYLLDNFEVQVLAVLIGLIFASALVLLKRSKNITWQVYVGILVGAGVSFLSPLIVQNPSALYLILGGAIAISAMLLPGISGSFLLLILGLYEFVLASLRSFDIVALLPFLLGILLGVILIIRLISYLFKSYPAQTLRLMIGFILGALLVPLRRIVAAYAGESLVLLSVLVVLGAALGYALEVLS